MTMEKKILEAYLAEIKRGVGLSGVPEDDGFQERAGNE